MDNYERLRRCARREFDRQQKRIQELIWSAGSGGKESRRRLAELRGKFTGRRCFVMGNGPTLLKCDISLLANEVTIGSNAQYLVWDSMGFAPTFFTVEDRLVAEDRATELCALEHPAKIFPRDFEVPPVSWTS